MPEKGGERPNYVHIIEIYTKYVKLSSSYHIACTVYREQRTGIFSSKLNLSTLDFNRTSYSLHFKTFFTTFYTQRSYLKSCNPI